MLIRSSLSHITRLLLSLLIPALLLTSAQAQKIKVEFDKNIDFTKFHTFALAPLDAVARPMLAAAIVGAIEQELNARGLKRTTSNPDIFVQIYGASDTDMAISYTDLYSGYGGIPPFDQSFLMWGAMPGTTTTVVVHKGQLVVDLIEAHQRKLAWRGIAIENLSDSRKKVVQQVNTAVEKMFKQYPIKANSK
jgi:Domain of unknown function (DUF4136)